MRIKNWKIACLKAAVVLVPSYTAAYLTEQMVWVVPTLAAASFFAAHIGLQDGEITQRVDEDGDADTGEGEDVVESFGDFTN